jgi:hypothetical protein
MTTFNFHLIVHDMNNLSMPTRECLTLHSSIIPILWKNEISSPEINQDITRLLGRPTTAYVSPCHPKIPIFAFLGDF